MFEHGTRESSYGGMVGWCPTSEELLKEAEERLLAHVKCLNPSVMVPIRPVMGRGGCKGGEKILTHSANTDSPNTPLVLVHGFGCGSGLWCLNLDAFAAHRPVYSMDVLGFGRSSRPDFSTVPLEAEDQFVASIEAWREAMHLDKFILLGHSFGGYLAAAYALAHPDRVVHLVLADPWGFAIRPDNYKVPVWARPIEVLSEFFNPLSILRVGGPLGPMYLKLFPPFKVSGFNGSVAEGEDAVANYFYHVNAKKPSGEAAFQSLMAGIAWGRYPMVPRMAALRTDIPVTFIFGEHSWVWKRSGKQVQNLLPHSYVDVQVLPNAGHALHSDNAQEFNVLVNSLLSNMEDRQRNDPASLPSWRPTTNGYSGHEEEPLGEAASEESLYEESSQQQSSEHPLPEYPSSEHSSSEHSSSEHSSSEHSSSEHPSPEHSSSEHSSSEHPSSEHSLPEHLSPEHPSPEHPSPEHPLPEHPSYEHSSYEHPSPEHLSPEHPSSEHPSSEHSLSEHPSSEHTLFSTSPTSEEVQHSTSTLLQEHQYPTPPLSKERSFFISPPEELTGSTSLPHG